MAYCDISDVAAYCRNILSGSADFTEESAPTAAQVERWMSSGCGILETRLSGWGYTVPVAETAQAYDWLMDLNALYAAAKAESSRTFVGTTLGERTRAQNMMRDFWDQLDEMRMMDMTAAGLVRAPAGCLYAGGTNSDTKAANAADTDVVQGRFRRGMFSYGGTRAPTPYDNSGTTNDN